MDRNILHAQSTYSVQCGCFSGEDDLCQTCTIDAKICRLRYSKTCWCIVGNSTEVVHMTSMMVSNKETTFITSNFLSKEMFFTSIIL